MTTASSSTASTVGKQMRASFITKYGTNFSETVQYSETFPTPAQRKEDLKDNQVLVHIKAAAINPIDFKIGSGKLSKIGIGLSKFPSVMGKDFSGIVIACGKKVKRVKEGDEVFGWKSGTRFGTFAEYAVLEEKEVAVKPKNLTWEQAAQSCMGYSTAFQTLLTYPTLSAMWKEKDTGENNLKAFAKEKIEPITKNLQVLVLGGSGGVGSYAVLFAKHFFKFGTVFATCSTKNVEYVKSLGADTVIDYTKQTVESVITNKIDLVVDTVGTEEAMYSSLKILKCSTQKGTFSSIATPDKDAGAVIGYTAKLTMKSIAGVAGTGPKAIMCMAKPSATVLDLFSKWADADPNNAQLLSLIPMTTFTLKETVKAFEQVQSKRTVGKNVIII